MVEKSHELVIRKSTLVVKNEKPIEKVYKMEKKVIRHACELLFRPWAKALTAKSFRPNTGRMARFAL